MSQINVEILNALQSASSFQDIRFLAESADIPNGIRLDVIFDAETSLLAFATALKATGKCIGLNIAFDSIHSRVSKDSSEPSVVLLVSEDIEICKMLYAAGFFKASQQRRETFAEQIVNVVSDRVTELRENYPKSAILIQTLPSPIVPPSGIQDIRQKQGVDITILETNIRLIEFGNQLSDKNIFVIGYHRYSTTVTRQYFESSVWATIHPKEQVKELHHLMVPAWWLCHWLYPLSLQRCKAIALDLDDTLWAGTLAEVGMDELQMGLSGTGYIHHRLQTHFEAMSQQGVMVGFVTRNQPAVISKAIKDLQQNNKLVVKPAAVEANVYASKSDLIINLCKFFDNIHPATVAFIDNSPIEREIVANSGIGCTVAPFPANVRLYEQMLLQLPNTEKLEISNTDRQRSIWYQEPQSGQVEFEVELICDPKEEPVVSRLQELIHKTNQFNLTTKRYTINQIGDLISDENAHVFGLRAFPLHQSLIEPSVFGVIITKSSKPDEWLLDTVLMSCRYMALGLDKKALKLVAQMAIEKSVRYLIGVYMPTERNALVKNWYSQNQFIYIKKNGNTKYYRALVDDLLRKTSESVTSLESYLSEKILLTSKGKMLSRTREADKAVEMFVSSGELKAGIDSQDAHFLESVFGLYPSDEVDRGLAFIKPFWIDKFCITNHQYALFINSTRGSCTERRTFLEDLRKMQPLCKLEFDAGQVRPCTQTENWPVVVPVKFATMYAGWVSGRLPTENEWEWSARGFDGRWFPWGNTLPSWKTVWVDSLHPGPVNSCPEDESPFGLRGMVGNVWQWCSTRFNNHPQYRGGDYRLDSAYWKRTTLRPLECAEHCGNVVGFRVVRDT